MEQNLPAENKTKTITLYNQVTHQYEVWNPFTGQLVSASASDAITDEHLKGFTLEKAQAISALVREGNSFPQIARMDGMPSLQILYYWKRHFPEFGNLVKEAREDRADLLVERYLDLVDSEDEIDEARARVIKNKIDAWKWAAEKMAPKEYGGVKDREPSSPTQINIYTGIVRDEPITVTIPSNREVGNAEEV